MLRTSTVAIRTSSLSTFVALVWNGSAVAGLALRAASISHFHHSIVRTPRAEMPRKKRAVVVKAMASPTDKTEKHNFAEGPENEGKEGSEPELTSAEDSDPGLNENKSKRKKTTTIKKKDLDKTTPKKKPAVSMKDKIKTKDRRRSHHKSAQVNTDYLPLPWKGRLGYVSPP